MDNDDKTAVRPELERTVTAGNARAIEHDITRRTAARKAYRAKTESLLDESSDGRLADVWQRVYRFPTDPAHELPDRRGIIEDLADFAEALRPSLDGMMADRLCRLIESRVPWAKDGEDLCRTSVHCNRPTFASGGIMASETNSESPRSTNETAEVAKQRVRRQPNLTFQRIWCEYDGGRLFLRGQVPSYYHKQLTQEAITGMEGVDHIANDVEVVW